MNDINLSKSKHFTKRLVPLCLFLLGAVLRIYRFGSIPGGFQMDEAYSAWNAFALYHSGIDSAGHSFPVYFEAWGHGMNALNSYLMLPFIALCAGHVNLVIIRLPQLMVSLASLTAVYALMRKMFSESTANWALFLVAICPWHVMMSRWGLESNLAPGFLIIGLCFFVYGLEKPPLLLCSAISYGLSLYCYATIWPIVPVMLLLQGTYCLAHKKLHPTRWLAGALAILGLLALPLICFLLINMGYLAEFQIGPFSVYKMTLFRSGELAHSLSEMVSNFKNMLYLFYHQDVGRPYDVIMPYGFFYNIGRAFIIIGVLGMIAGCVRSIVTKKFSYLCILMIQLIGAGIVGLLISVNMTQINCAYIPLVLCEALGVTWVLSFLKEHFRQIARTAGCVIIIAVYLYDLFGFQYRYYTEYKELSSAYFQQGTDDAVKTALSIAKSSEITDIYIDAGLKYPNILLSTETTAEEYLDTVVYSENLPAPECFTKTGITFHMGYSPEDIADHAIYIIYQTDVDAFEDFRLMQFCDWYVAVP
jgi:hypothetical protein